MTKKEMLEAYRERVIELDELRRQIKRVGTDGRPNGVRAAQFEHISGTNDPAAAAMHLADGLESLAQRKEEELMMLAGPVDMMLRQIEDYRTFIVMQRYYKLAETDEQVALALNMSRTHINRLRHIYLKESA